MASLERSVLNENLTFHENTERKREQLLSAEEEKSLGRILLEVRAAKQSIGQRQAEGLPVLSKSETVEEWDRKERKVKEELLERNLGLIFKFALDTCMKINCPIGGNDFEDMIQEGYLAFWRALDKWDYQKAKVGSYAGESAKRAIHNFSLRVGRSMEFSGYFWRAQKEFSRAVVLWEQENQKRITSEEIIKLLSEIRVGGKQFGRKDQNIKKRAVEVFLGKKDWHLEDFLDEVEKDKTFLEVLWRGESLSVQAEVEQRLLQVAVRKALEGLPFQEKRVLELRNGFNGGEPELLEQIGFRFDRTRARIQQIEKGALKRLRHPSRSRPLRDFL